MTIHRKQTISRISSAFGTFALVGLLAAGCDSDDDSGDNEPTAGKDAAGGAGGKGGSGGGGSAGKGGSGGEESSDEGGKGGAGGAGGASEAGRADGSENPDAGASDDEPGDKKGLYAFAVEIYNPDNTSNTYLTVTDSLDIKSIDMKAAKELAGRADAWTYDGKVFITSDESPTVKRYNVSDDGKLTDEKTISFQTLGVESTARLENIFISKTKAYLGIEGGYAIWNPDEMKLAGEIKVPEFAVERDDKTINGSTGVLRGDKIYKSVVWIDWATYTFSKEQFIAVFDTKTDKLISMDSEERCPALTSQPTLDADGNLIFSNWYFNVPGVLTADAPKSCAIRIPKGADKVDDWKLEFDKIAGGHEGSQVSYTDKGQAIFSVFREDGLTITKDSDPFELTSGLNWETWTLDLKKPESAKAVTGVDRAAATQANNTVDGRTFVFLPDENYAKTKAFEILPDAKSRAAFDFDGTTFVGFVKIK